MDQVKIGKLIAECRKAKKLTQVELANLLGVTDKSISKWENGICLPDVSLYMKICEILDITLNEFFSGERLTDESFKQVADSNLLSALENSTFTLRDKIDFFKRKWQKDHFFEIIVVMLVIIVFIIYGFIKDNGLQYVFMIIGFISGVIENNKMMAYVEKNAYGKKSNISIEEFRNYVNKQKEFKKIISKFDSKDQAIDYLVNETGLSREECSCAYDLTMKIDYEKKLHLFLVDNILLIKKIK